MATKKKQGRNIGATKKSVAARDSNVVPPSRLDEDTSLIVRGTVTTADGQPIRGAIARAFDRDLRKEQPLGDAETNERGEYIIRYGSAQFGMGDVPSAPTPKLIVRAFEGDRQRRSKGVGSLCFSAHGHLDSGPLCFSLNRRPAKRTLSMALSESGPLQAPWIICGITVILSPGGAFRVRPYKERAQQQAPRGRSRMGSRPMGRDAYRHPGQGCHWREPLPDPGEDRQQVLRRRLHKERRGGQIDQLPQGGSPIGANL